MSIMVGVGRAAAAGVLIRQAEALERLAKVDVLVVDKTGTLTEGRPAVTAIVPTLPFNEAELLAHAASIEVGSEHPLGVAIVEAARERGLALRPFEDFRSPSGKGVGASVNGRKVRVGSAAFLAADGVPVGDAKNSADALMREGATAIFVAIDGRLAGTIAIADPIKSDSATVIGALKDAGVTIVMLTGDTRTTAEAVAKKLGIERVEAGVLPEGKLQIVQQLREEGHVVAMAGDGVNDAPALSAADVGIAMGAGTDVAIQSAGIVLLKSDLNGIMRARQLSRAIIRNIRENLALAFVYNAAGVPVAAGVLYPAFGLLLSPIFAAAAMSLSSVSVVANALRLRGLRLEAP
jgi:Cu+-exporting ATPase